MRSCPERAYILAFFAPHPPLSDENPAIPMKILLLIKCYTREIRKSFYSLQFDFLFITQSLKLVSKFSVSVIESYSLKSSGS